MSKLFNYQPYGETPLFIESDHFEGQALVVEASKQQFDNGIYGYFITETGENRLYILKPNTANRAALVNKMVDKLNTVIATNDPEELDAFNWVEVVSHVLEQSILKPIAQRLFPDNPLKQKQWSLVYAPRFLGNTARFHNGDSELKEEAVNAEPYAVKAMIEMTTPEQEVTE